VSSVWYLNLSPQNQVDSMTKDFRTLTKLLENNNLRYVAETLVFKTSALNQLCHSSWFIESWWIITIL